MKQYTKTQSNILLAMQKIIVATLFIGHISEGGHDYTLLLLRLVKPTKGEILS